MYERENIPYPIAKHLVMSSQRRDDIDIVLRLPVIFYEGSGRWDNHNAH
jgi:hypothetical protein